MHCSEVYHPLFSGSFKENEWSTNYYNSNHKICLKLLNMIFLSIHYYKVKKKFKYFRFKI